MGFFSERTRVKVDAIQGVVRISVRSDETSVEEFIFPFEECDHMFEAVGAGLNFSSRNFKIIFKPSKVFVQFRENALKRKIFNFNAGEFQLLCVQFANERLKVEKLDPSQRSTILDTCDDIMSLSISLNKHFDKLFKEVRVASQLPFDLEPYLKSIDSRLGNIEKTLKEKGIQVTTSQVLQRRDDSAFDMDDEFFIPETFKDDFEGKIQTQKSAERSSTETASEALKKLKNRNNKKGDKK